MEIKDYIYDEERQEATVWFGKIDPYELYEFLKEFNKQHNKSKGLDFHLDLQDMLEPIKEKIL